MSVQIKSGDNLPRWTVDLSDAITPTPVLAEQISEALYKAIVSGQSAVNTRLTECALANSFTHRISDEGLVA